MKLTALILGVLPLTTLTCATDTEGAAYKRVIDLQKIYQKNIQDVAKNRTTGCTNAKLLQRKEWGALSQADRLSYINAVYCLANLTNITPLSEIPGARSRYDDFLGVHIQQTPFVHSNGLFLGFHRYYVHLYEKALRDECGYQGAQPYWDWSLSYQDPRNSTVLDGSPYSLGSNGAYIPNRGPTGVSILPGAPPIEFPPATGGGCVYSGPFTPDKFTVNLGPIAFDPIGPNNGTGYNPRCLTRDLSPIFSSFTRPSNLSSLLDGCSDVGCVEQTMDAQTGVHGGGHFQVGGIELDLYASPADPIFWLHHAQIDRLWAIWQGQDLQGRVNQVAGTVTSFNVPPSEDATLNSQVNFGVASPPKVLGDLVSTIDGDLCYIYV